MTPIRKKATVREKELQLAIFRIERGRSHSKETKLSIAAVAREAGVTPALIHNHYPSIAETIRVKLNASSRKLRDQKQTELKQAQERIRVLQVQLTESAQLVAALASSNEVLRLEVRTLTAIATDNKVVRIPSNGAF